MGIHFPSIQSNDVNSQIENYSKLISENKTQYISLPAESLSSFELLRKPVLFADSGKTPLSPAYFIPTNYLKDNLPIDLSKDVEYHANGQIKKATLSKDVDFEDTFLKEGDEVEFFSGGLMKKMTLHFKTGDIKWMKMEYTDGLKEMTVWVSEDVEMMGLKYKANTPLKTTTKFDRVSEITISEDQKIKGIWCKGGLSAPVKIGHNKM